MSKELISSSFPLINPDLISSPLGVNSDEERVHLIQSIQKLVTLTASAPRLLRFYGVCIEGAPLIRNGVEILLISGALHYLVSLPRLLQWAAINKPEVSEYYRQDHGCLT